MSVEVKSSGYIIIHRCLDCGVEKRNRSASNDSIEAILEVMKSHTSGEVECTAECVTEELQIPSVPHLVHIETTYACNGRCVFCYNPSRSIPFNKDKVDRIVRSIYESWIPHVYLIGGEPSLLGVKQLNEYIELLADRSSVTIVTNGLLFLDGLSSRLACIGIPIHGNQETHERHTLVSGGYLKMIENVGQYVADGFDVRCIPVLTAWNFDQMYEVIRLASQLSMESVFVDRFEDGGIGNERSPELKPSLNQFKVALTQMIQARNDFGIAVGFGTAIPYCLDERLIAESMFANCGVGITFAAINPNGDVRICNQSQIIYGNVLAESIEQIWKKKQLNEFRNLSWVTAPCRSCAVLTECLCGCKVDCSCSSGYCVDYAVRGFQKPPHPVTEIPCRELPIGFPKDYRQLKIDPFTKLNTFHIEPYLVTRYQTVRLDEMAVQIIRELISVGQCNEKVIITRFADSIEETEVRSFITKLIAIKAISEI